MGAVVLADTRGMAEADWLAERRAGIGSSDAAAIAGLNPWRSPLAVYLDKRGEVPPEPENEAMHFGKVLESVVADEFALRTGFKVRRRNAILQSAEHPIMIANLDREVREPDGTWSLLEAKTGSAWTAEQWEDDKIPDQYAIQVHHQLVVTGRDHGWIAVLLGGQRFLKQRIDYDPEIAEYLVALEAAFWQRVQDGNPPPPDGSESAEEALSLLYPHANAGEMDLPYEAEALIEQYRQGQADEKAAKAVKDEAKQRLCALLGEAEVGLLGGRPAVRWSNAHRDAYTVKATDYRQFSLVKQKGAR